MPQGISLVPKPTDGEEKPPLPFARGVDLEAVRNKHKHRHRWAVITKFAISDLQVDTMRADAVERSDQIRQGADPETTAAIDTVFELGDETMLDNTGPLCVKCACPWFHPDAASLCKESDDDQFTGDVGAKGLETYARINALVKALDTE